MVDEVKRSQSWLPSAEADPLAAVAAPPSPTDMFKKLLIANRGDKTCAAGLAMETRVRAAHPKSESNRQARAACGDLVAEHPCSRNC
jgi:hypothetical protein